MNDNSTSINAPSKVKGVSVLITGASGFVGSHLVDYALAQGFETYACVRASSSKAYLQDTRIRFLDLPLSDETKLTEQLQQFKTVHGIFDYVVHAAGIINATDKQQFDRVNFGFTQNLVNALIAADMTPKKLVYISSLSAFGPGDAVSQRPIMHHDTPQPNTTYGKSKLKAEQYLFSLPAFPFVILRPTGIYGPRDRGYLTYVKMVNSGFVPLLGRAAQYVTFVHVQDLAKVVFAALESPLTRRAYFVADGDVYTTREYAAIVKKHLGKKRVLPVTVPLWVAKAVFYAIDTVCGWFGRVPPSMNRDKYNILSARSWICDTAPLRNDLHFAPEHHLDAATKALIAAYRETGWL